MAEKRNIRFIIGDDDYLVSEAAKAVRDASVPEEFRDTAIEIVGGEASNQEEQMLSLRNCRDSLDTPPFLDPVKLTWWRNVTFLPGGGRGGKLAEDVKTALEKFAKRLASSPPPSNQTLLVTAPKLLMTSVFAKTLKDVAEIEVIAGESKPSKMVEAALMRLPALAKAAGVEFAPGAERSFITRTGADTRTIVSELQKLSTYLGDERRPITGDDVAEITSVSGGEPEIWELTDAIARLDANRALNVFMALSGDSGAPILVATVLEKFFRELSICREAVERGWLDERGNWSKGLPPAAAADLDAASVGPGAGKNAWALRNLAQQAMRFDARQLRVNRYRMLDLREKIVSGRASATTVEMEIVRLIRSSSRRPSGNSRAR